MPEHSTIRAFIADDYPFFRLGLRVFLEEEGAVHSVGEAGNAAETVERVRSLRPDVILLDLDLPPNGGLAVLADLRSISPETRCVVLSRWDDERHLISALEHHVEGYVLKSADPQVILLAIQAVHRGETWLQRELTAKLVSEFSRLSEGKRQVEQLTPRELEVLELLAMGQRNAEIAHKLFISERTVKAHVSSMLHKLHLSDRMQAIHYAIRNGLVRV